MPKIPTFFGQFGPNLWKFEKLKNLQKYRSFDERERGRIWERFTGNQRESCQIESSTNKQTKNILKRKLNKQTNKNNLKKEGKQQKIEILQEK